MGADELDEGGRGPELRPTWASPEVGRSQVLVRQVSARRGWFRSADYETAYYPEGLATSPQWVRRSASPGVPGLTHTTDLHDLHVLLEQAWREGDRRWVAWPVWYPAAARRRDLRPARPDEEQALADHRARQRVDARTAGEVPVRLRHPRRGGPRVVDGPVHELTAPGRTRCGLVEPDLVDLTETFLPRDPQACPECSSAWAG